MDKEKYKVFDDIQGLNFEDADFKTEIDDLNFEELLEYIANSPPPPISPPLKPNQTWSTEKISIRVPRYILDHFRAESDRLGLGYQTLMNQQLSLIFIK
jgi:uncharacterized protein (DUF4415 family)